MDCNKCKIKLTKNEEGFLQCSSCGYYPAQCRMPFKTAGELWEWVDRQNKKIREEKRLSEFYFRGIHIDFYTQSVLLHGAMFYKEFVIEDKMQEEDFFNLIERGCLVSFSRKKILNRIYSGAGGMRTIKKDARAAVMPKVG